MKIVDQELLAWIKERVAEFSGKTGYTHSYEIYAEEGDKALWKLHGDYQNDPHHLAIWIQSVAAGHGPGKYKVVFDANLEKGFGLEVPKGEQYWGLGAVYLESFFALYKWYDVLSYKVKLERLELREVAGALVGEWLNLTAPNDQVIDDVYRAAHGCLENSIKAGARVLEDNYSLLCFAEGNPVTYEKFTFKVPFQHELLVDKDFQLPLDGWDQYKPKKGTDEMNINHDLVTWAEKCFNDEIQRYELRDAVTDTVIQDWSMKKDQAVILPNSPLVCAVTIHRAAWYDLLFRKDFKAIIVNKDGGISSCDFKIEAAPAQRIPTYRSTPFAAPFPASAGSAFISHPFEQRMTSLDWLEKAWPMIEKGVDVLVDNARGKPYSVEMHERFMDIHSTYMSQYFEARQQDKAQKDGIFAALSSVLPVVMNMYAPKVDNPNDAIREKLVTFFISMDPKDIEAMVSSMKTYEQQKAFMDLYTSLVTVISPGADSTADSANDKAGPRKAEPWRATGETGAPSAE